MAEKCNHEPMTTYNDKEEKLEICWHCGKTLRNFGKQTGRHQDGR